MSLEFLKSLIDSDTKILFKSASALICCVSIWALYFNSSSFILISWSKSIPAFLLFNSFSSNSSCAFFRFSSDAILVNSIFSIGVGAGGCGGWTIDLPMSGLTK